MKYKKKTEVTGQSQKEKREQAENSIKQAMIEARNCLKLKAFQKYKEKYEIAKKSTIKYILQYRNPDPVKYAFHIQDFANDLRSLSTLLNEVKQDAHD